MVVLDKPTANCQGGPNSHKKQGSLFESYTRNKKARRLAVTDAGCLTEQKEECT